MVTVDHTASLLPYLRKQDSGFLLEFDAAPAGQFPFTVVKSGPFSKIIKGRVVSDAQSTVLDVFCLVQNDQYQEDGNALLPLDNPTVDAGWERAIIALKEKTGNDKMITLKGQWGQDDTPVPFNPLLYCREKNRWLPLLCPKCQSELALLKDDALLQQMALPAYTLSTSRFLYCPSCHLNKGSSDLFAPSISPLTPRVVKGINTIIKGMGLALDAGVLPKSVACRGCDALSSCYGDENKIARERIGIFSFFPFHFMMFEAPDLCVVDFLKMISGMPSRQLEQELKDQNLGGRLAVFKRFVNTFKESNRVFYSTPDKNKQILEVIYLKLSILKEIYSRLKSSKISDKKIALPPEPEGIWVKLKKTGHGLPAFWTFDLHLIDPIREPHTSRFLKHGTFSDDRRFMCALWFYALTANKNNSMARIYEILEEILAHESKIPVKNNVEDVVQSLKDQFPPGSVFWDCGSEDFGSAMDSIWEEALFLGIGCIGSEIEPDFILFEKDFLTRLNRLLNNIKGALFGRDRDIVVQPKEKISVVPILERISLKWKNEQNTVEQAPLEKQEMPEIPLSQPKISNTDGWDDAIEETVVMSGPPGEPDQPGPMDLDETIIINGNNGPGGSPQPQSYGHEEIEETVIISRDPSAQPPGWETDELPQTVVVTPGEDKVSDAGIKNKADIQKSDTDGLDDIMEETIIIRSDIKGPANGSEQ